MTQELVEKIEFEDEHGFIASVGVKYEWKPILCTHCKGLGHTAEACRKKSGVQTQQQWVMKTKKVEEKNQLAADSDGFKPVTNGWKPKETEQQEQTSIENAFDILQEHTEENGAGVQVQSPGMDKKRGGGVPPLQNG
ncbi:hypothetical protein CsatB_003469 [Cannabis sativa]